MRVGPCGPIAPLPGTASCPLGCYFPPTDYVGYIRSSRLLAGTAPGLIFLLHRTRCCTQVLQDTAPSAPAPKREIILPGATPHCKLSTTSIPMRIRLFGGVLACCPDPHRCCGPAVCCAALLAQHPSSPPQPSPAFLHRAAHTHAPFPRSPPLWHRSTHRHAQVCPRDQGRCCQAQGCAACPGDERW
jgi:hypothetical protein